VLDEFTPAGFVLESKRGNAEESNSVTPTSIGFELYQNHPNPFNPETEIKFKLSESRFVTLTVFNTLGQKVRILIEDQYQAGFHSVKWDGTDENGNQVSGGLYFYQIKAGDFVQLKKMSFVR